MAKDMPEEWKWVVVKEVTRQMSDHPEDVESDIVAMALCKSEEDAELIRAALSLLKERVDCVSMTVEEWFED
jgi:hypothetical protein